MGCVAPGEEEEEEEEEGEEEEEEEEDVAVGVNYVTKYFARQLRTLWR